MDPQLAWALGFMLLAILLIALEVFIPSGGILSVCSAVSAIVGVVLLYRFDTVWGHTGLAAVAILGPAIAIFLIKVWPHTPIGRRIINAPTEEQVEQLRAQEEVERTARQRLVGRQGRVLTDLRPVGTIEIDGVRHEVLSETTFVPVGATVQVTYVDLAQIKVRRV